LLDAERPGEAHAGVVATGYEPVELGFYGLAWRRGASEIPVQSRPDWSVVYQHGLLLQTHVCPMFSRLRENFTSFTVLSEIDEDQGK
jgi:hypothetical protein